MSLPDRDNTDGGADRRSTLLAFAMGTVAGLVLMGPALGPGALLNLDLSVVPQPAWPEAVVGSGTEIPRAHPFDLIVVALGRLFSAPAVIKAFSVLSVAAATAGASRLAPNRHLPMVLATGLLYGVSPWLLTRMAVGHLTMVGVAAILPWVLPHLLQPARDLRRTFLAAAALGLMGIFGGICGGLLIGAGLVSSRGRSAVRVGGVFLASQLPWLTSGLVVVGRGVDVVDSSAFPSEAGLWLGPFRLGAGHGFWQTPFQVGGEGAATAAAGAVLLGLAIVGSRDIERRFSWFRSLRWIAIVSFVGIVADGTSGTDNIVEWLTSNPVGATLREPQRLALFIALWIAGAATAGSVRVLRKAKALDPAQAFGLPLALALALAAPGMWGLGGQLNGHKIPSGWATAKSLIDADPGPVIGLPWARYLNLGFADNRRVLNPLGRFLHGDVVLSSDIGLGAGSAETTDDREAAVSAQLNSLLEGRSVADELAAEGFRWVVLLHEASWRSYATLDADPGATLRYGDNNIDLYELSAWTAQNDEDDSDLVDARTIALPALHVVVLIAAIWSGASLWQRRHRHQLLRSP